MVELAWLGPKATDLLTLAALQILINYLTDTAVAPLRQDFVQTAEPYCSSVNIYISEQTLCEITASFYDVPSNKLDQIRDRFFNKTVCDHMKK